MKSRNIVRKQRYSNFDAGPVLFEADSNEHHPRHTRKKLESRQSQQRCLPFASKSECQRKMTDNGVEKNGDRSPGSKTSRSKVGMFLSKVSGRDSPSVEAMMEKLSKENKRLRRELKEAKNRILELEVSAALSTTTTTITTTSTDDSTDLDSLEFTQNQSDDRDDNVYSYGQNDINECDNLSVEVEASAVEAMRKSTQEKVLNFDDVQSVTASACTMPTGNDKKSKRFRHQLDLRRRLRGSRSSSRSHTSRADYVGRRYLSRNNDEGRTPMESITEIHTHQRQDRTLLESYGVVDLISTTSDLSSSVASSARSNEALLSGEEDGLMSGRMLPLRAMKSLLRISSTDSDEHSIGMVDEEPSLFGEI